MSFDVNMSRNQFLEAAREWLACRRGLWGGSPDEFLVGYVDNFIPVFAAPYLDTDEPLFVWFIFPGKSIVARIVNWISQDVFVDHEGNVHEHAETWTLVLGTVRKGNMPLLTREMVGLEDNDES